MSQCCRPQCPSQCQSHSVVNLRGPIGPRGFPGPIGPSGNSGISPMCVQVSNDPNPDQFPTITDAIFYIQNTAVDGPASIGNPWKIEVLIGTFVEPTTVSIPSGIVVTGMGIALTTVLTADTSTTFTLTSSTTLSDLTIIIGTTGIETTNPGFNVVVSDVTFIGASATHIGLNIIQTAASFIPTIFTLNNIDIINCGFPVIVDSTGAISALRVEITHLAILKSIPLLTTDAIHIMGGQTLLTLTGSLIQGDGTALSETAVRITDGASVFMTSPTMIAWVNGVVADNTVSPNTADLQITGAKYDGISGLQIDIQDSAITGIASGNITFENTFIDPDSIFRIIPYIHNQFTVGISGAMFTSVSAALANVTSPSSSNTYSILVGPGVFTESQIIMQTYVSIVGSGKHETNLLITNTSSIIGAGHCQLSNMTLSCQNPAITTLITHQGDLSGGLFIVDQVRFEDCNTVFIGNDTNGNTLVNFTNCNTTLAATWPNGFSITGSNGNLCLVKVDGFIGGSVGATDLDNWANNYFMKVSGTTGSGFINNTNLERFGVADPGIFAEVGDGGSIQIIGCTINRFDTGVDIIAGGADPRVTAVSTAFFNMGTTSLIVNNSDSMGTITISGDISQISIPVELLHLNITIDDPEGPYTHFHDVQLGHTTSEITQINGLLLHSAPVGLLEGGVLSQNGVLTIDVTAGNGYLQTSGSNKFTEWSADTGNVLGTETQTYFYVDSSGSVLTTTGARPNMITNILLGRVVTDDTDILWIQNDFIESNELATRQEVSSRDGLGGVFSTPLSITDPSLTTIGVSSGTYCYGSNMYSVTGASPINMNIVLSDGGGGFQMGTGINPTTTVTNALYDLGGSETALTPGRFTMHYLYTAGGTDFSLQLGQNEQLTADAAIANPAVILFGGSCIVIAGIVVEGGVGIDQIVNLTESASSSGSGGGVAPTDHNALSNLTVGDVHTQYLPLTGVRAMTGDLAMAANDITTSGLVDGVTVSAHEARHLTGGADPIPVATLVADGLMPTGDRVLLNGATNTALASTLVQRDGSSNSAFNAVELQSGAFQTELVSGTLGADLTLTMPDGPGLAEQYLYTTDTAGTLAFKGGYGFIYQTTDHTLIVDSVTPVVIPMDANGSLSSGTVTPDFANNRITTTTTGVYLVTIQGNIYLDLDIFGIGIYLNGILVEAGELAVRSRGSTSQADYSISALVNITVVGDFVDVRCINLEGATDDLTFERTMMRVEKM